MRFHLPALAFLVVGCGQAKDNEDAKLLPEERRQLRLNPPGRFVMLPAREAEGVYVMDSTDGSIRFCRPMHEFEGMGCGPAAPQ